MTLGGKHHPIIQQMQTPNTIPNIPSDACADAAACGPSPAFGVVLVAVAAVAAVASAAAVVAVATVASAAAAGVLAAVAVVAAVALSSSGRILKQ